MNIDDYICIEELRTLSGEEWLSLCNYIEFLGYTVANVYRYWSLNLSSLRSSDYDGSFITIRESKMLYFEPYFIQPAGNRIELTELKRIVSMGL